MTGQMDGQAGQGETAQGAHPATVRLAALRAVLDGVGAQACVVPSGDPHLSEYLPPHWQGRQWLSGFDGSAGTLVVTRREAALWTDSRYWTQAASDLDGSGIVLMRAGDAGVPEPAAWLATVLTAGSRVCVDGMTWSLKASRQWRGVLETASLVLDESVDLLATAWTDRPALPAAPVVPHPLPYAVRTRAQNLAALREAMQEHAAGWHWVSALDDIAWALNLRGSDVDYNPVFLAHLLVGQRTAVLYVARERLAPGVAEALAADGVDLAPYEKAVAGLAALAPDETVLVDPARCAAALLGAAHARRVEAPNPAIRLKACKWPQERAHVRDTMVNDGVALCEFFARLEAALGVQHVTELDVDAWLLEARARQPGFVCPSFPTIAGYNANGAMPHYRATPHAYAAIEGDGLLLIDSGGQYLGGTTDITRMVAVGNVSDAQREDCTRVLQGMMALSRAVFPDGLPAPLLDPLARAPLWRAGLDYGHGTGHGVGYFMNVHEGPQAISHRAAGIAPLDQMAMAEGMITSNEPGLYRPGQWGIRIENLVLAVPAPATEFGCWLRFETLTLCPIDTRCLQPALLSDDERQWLDDYHAQVRDALLPRVSGAARDWLLARTAPLS